MKKGSRLAIVDHLTQLYNRRYFDQCLRKFISEAKKEKNHFSLLMIDIDNFKTVNDKYGHFEGDKVLIEFAKVLKTSTRKDDICFRYGGDEIAIILPVAGKGTAEIIRGRIKTKIEQHKFSVEGEDNLLLKLSIGIAVFPEGGLTSESMIKKADEFLYEDKHLKRGPIRKITEAFILKTKLAPPSPKEKVILRPQLISSLRENLLKRLILIIADAGYGKTTLLTQLIKDEKFPCVYYDLDKNDSDLSIFLNYLTHGFERIQPDLARRTRGLLKQGSEAVSNHELMMGTLINELVEKRKQELFIVLDDYHNLNEDSIVHKALDYFIDHLPDIIHVIIASRTIPLFASLTKWRSKQDLFELSRDNIKFTEEEVKILLNEVYKIVLPEDELKRVSEKTEGWITGIQLILQSAGTDGKVPAAAGIKETLNGYLEANQPLFDYFANEILRYEPAEVQEFLIKSSVLDIMTPEVCNGILKMRGSEVLLRDIKKHNMFVSVVGKEEYKYHRLFQDFLVGQIKDEAVKKAIHLKAADYYKEKGLLEQCIEHYLVAGSYEWAGKVIAQVADEMIWQGQLDKLKTWLQGIPKVVCERQPRLLVFQGMLCLEEGRFEEAEELFVQTESLFRIGGLREEGDSTALMEALTEHGKLLRRKGYNIEALRVLGKAHRVCPSSDKRQRTAILNSMGLSWSGLGNLKKAQRCLRQAMTLSKDPKHPLWINIESNLAFLLDSQGETRQAVNLNVSLIERYSANYFQGAGFMFAHASIMALDLGRVEWAEQCLNKGLSLCTPYNDPLSHTALQYGLGVLYTDKAQWEEGIQHLEKAKEEFINLGWLASESRLHLALARLHRYRRYFDEAQKHLDQSQEKADKEDRLLAVNILAEMSLLKASCEKFMETEQIAQRALKLIRQFGLKKAEFVVLLA